MTADRPQVDAPGAKTEVSEDETPTIAVLCGLGESHRIASLVRHLARQVNVVAWRPTGPRPDALVASSSEALERGPSNWNGPTAVWLDTAGQGQLLVGGPEEDDEARTVAGRSRVVRIPLPDNLWDLPDWDPMPPTVRARWRLRIGWPDTVVVPPGRGASHVTKVDASAQPDADRGASPDASPAPIALLDLPELAAARRTALALASAAVVTAQDLPTAVALATPCVCLDPIGDPELAALVATHQAPAAAITAACALVDPVRAAHASAALTRYRQAHQVGQIADAVLVALGLQGAPRSPGAVARIRLTEIGLPPDSPLAARVRDAFAGFSQNDRFQGALP